MNMKNLVIGVLSILAIGGVVVTIMSTPEEVEQRTVQVIQYEETRTRMQDILVAGMDMREYRIRATYRLPVQVASTRRMCEKKITNVISETSARTGLDPNGARQIHTALMKALAGISRYDDNCGVRSPFVSVFETVPGD